MRPDLAAAPRALEDLGGGLSVDPTSGQGATLRFFLPMTTGARAAANGPGSNDGDVPA